LFVKPYEVENSVDEIVVAVTHFPWASLNVSCVSSTVLNNENELKQNFIQFF